ncbi:hypothetical protein [Undibacterium sp. TC9W]|uniref:hypothetical protein n=1 Tax=Undibacterium sp. TC9W TaxID=3413053 RepID=UPI003BF31865
MSNDDLSYDYAALLDTALSDIDVAIAGLKLSTQATKEQIAAQSALLEQQRAARKQALEGQVERVLPDFSSAALLALEQHFPGFVDDLVRETFRENRKILGLFSRSGSDNAMIILKTRLAFFLNHQQGSYFDALDEQVMAVKGLIQNLEQLYYGDLDLLQALEELRGLSGDIPPAMQRQIHQLAMQTRELAARRVRGGAPGPAAENDYPASDMTSNYSYDDNRAWIYLGTVSYTDNAYYGHVDTSTGTHSDTNNDTATDRPLAPDCDDQPGANDVPICVSDRQLDQSALIMDMGNAVILTDDSLGRFS